MDKLDACESRPPESANLSALNGSACAATVRLPTLILKSWDFAFQAY